MTITIPAGEKLAIEFEDADGQFEIHFDTKEYRSQLVVKETGGLPGSEKGEACEILYLEKFGREL